MKESTQCYVNNRLADGQTQVYENFTVEWKKESIPEETAPAEEEAVPLPEEAVRSETETQTITVFANGVPAVLSGKKSYVFVDIFDAIDFDLSKPQGTGIVTKLNDRDAQYMEELHQGDKIEIYWRMA